MHIGFVQLADAGQLLRPFMGRQGSQLRGAPQQQALDACPHGSQQQFAPGGLLP
jgi:hypothetical protein